jgi:hypothetical protein
MREWERPNVPVKGHRSSIAGPMVPARAAIRARVSGASMYTADERLQSGDL